MIRKLGEEIWRTRQLESILRTNRAYRDEQDRLERKHMLMSCMEISCMCWYHVVCDEVIHCTCIMHYNSCTIYYSYITSSSCVISNDSYSHLHQKCR